MEWLKLQLQRLKCWSGFVGREIGYYPGRFGVRLAWRTACAIHPNEDLDKWWLGTGWMGPSCPAWYCGWPSWQLEHYFIKQNQKEIGYDGNA